jgi:3',5'-cyclic AMP phosphodiesterase CpdA
MRQRKFQLLAVAMLLAQSALAQITIGPYVQRVAPDRATVVWYTSSSTPGTLRYGTASGQWLGSVEAPAATVHAVEATGLQGNTKYFYEIANGATVLASGPDYYFVTHIPAGARVPFSFIAAGDLADGSQNQKDVAARMMLERSKHKFALFLGDIVYSSGTRNEYLKQYFPVYKDLIRHLCIWPTLGNHDVSGSRADAYFEFFYTPTNNPGSIEHYYSFDYANAHIISLDDEIMKSGANLNTQLDWAKQDLANAKSRGQNWLIAMFHKPPYTRGTHTDDDETKRNFVPVLEAAGVDLVLCGHSHVAERTFLLNNNKIIDQNLSSYPKNGVTPGTVYVVSGSGGKTGELAGKHPLMAFQAGQLGGFEIIYINNDTLKGSYMKKDGSIIDNFTMIKKGLSTHVDIKPNSAQPLQYVVNYPNPFRPGQSNTVLNIAFEISQNLPVQAAIYDLTGREVTRLSDGQIFNPGRQMLQWNGKGADGLPAAPGMYFYRLQAGSQIHKAKVLLLP